MRLVLIPLVLLLSSTAAVGSPEATSRSRVVAGLEDVRIEPVRRIRGRAFEWDHEIQIALPASYRKTNRSYPVLWVTDGAVYFELAVKAVNYDLRRHVPEMIVVAVGAPPEERGETGFGYRRNYEFLPSPVRGFTGFGGDLLNRQLAAAQKQSQATAEPGMQGGGAAPFLAFLVDELRVALSKDYRMASEHTLFGDSGGGVFCVYALLARPEAFTRYVCGSPNLYSGDFALFRMEEGYAKAHDDLTATVFFGAGEAEVLDPNGIVRGWGVVSATARMAEVLSLRNYPSLRLYARIFPDEDHASVPPVNLSWGLRTVWQDDARKTVR